jgi:hypothetical protein
VNGWYKITVPSTFVAGLLVNHEYNFDPFYSQNFEKLADKRMIQPGGTGKNLLCLLQKKIKT